MIELANFDFSPFDLNLYRKKIQIRCFKLAKGDYLKDLYCNFFIFSPTEL